VPFTSFALFIGVAMSITAFPVLARILTDYGMTRTPLGVTALSCAAIDDVTAWCLLAFVVGRGPGPPGLGLLVTLELILHRLHVRRGTADPREATRAPRGDPPGRMARSPILAALLLSALAAEAIGIHAIFGAFLLGAPWFRTIAAVAGSHRSLERVVTILLLPRSSPDGMRTRIDLLGEPAALADLRPHRRRRHGSGSSEGPSRPRACGSRSARLGGSSGPS
jgi:Kef-type K+ transport system membrane component KefB